ncbi:phosphinothricin acetyltransferase [Formivibrio citricus]|uniref:Phosphinothricin acetyltransferase n=1 Tax=Formivibrio citricus TaxID=83765 RepID=A0A1I5D2A6_9NEIS|nr:GNAT family N-acetyltransferase [Formivibrio citricus]SFN93273.1 phosphinothricin acetyltransferase [Formivibrio citricus]
MSIRPATQDDAAAIAAIYNPYIRDTVITFEYDEVSAAEIAARIAKVQQHFDWLVLEEAGRIVGYAYYGKFRERKAYDGTVETSIYLVGDASGQGRGRRLYAALLEAIKAKGFREVIGCLALPNEASVALHEKMGFAKVGHFPGVGFKFGRFVDVGFWQLSVGNSE